MNEDFENWWMVWCDLTLDKWGMKRMAMDAWDQRQPEIDALKAENDKLRKVAEQAALALAFFCYNERYKGTWQRESLEKLRATLEKK